MFSVEVTTLRTRGRNGPVRRVNETINSRRLLRRFFLCSHVLDRGYRFIVESVGYLV